MSTVTIRYAHPDTGTRETRTTPAYPCGVPGLLIGPAYESSGWIITHERSGLAVGWFPGADPEAVLAAAAGLGPLADWTASAHDLHSTDLRARTLVVLDRWGGQFCTATIATSADRDDLAGGAS